MNQLYLNLLRNRVICEIIKCCVPGQFNVEVPISIFPNPLDMYQSEFKVETVISELVRLLKVSMVRFNYLTPLSSLYINII